jgi:hypothetical protein
MIDGKDETEHGILTAVRYGKRATGMDNGNNDDACHVADIS